MSYKHLSQSERYQIYALKKVEQNLKTIAKILGNSSLRDYRPRQAEILCQQLAQACRNCMQNDPVTRKLVAERTNAFFADHPHDFSKT